MYEAATTLRVPLGARYVSAAICACASHAKSAVACSQDQPKSVAEALGRLASVWLAFVLWPRKLFDCLLLHSVSFRSSRPRLYPSGVACEVIW
ncbi:hypothetical protein BD310DRAFT_937083 [Dichomitus squalens]|uniref:Uncharacterized protein n=1 Tax=Dichomitus squalens TaxID=114155 RepID=A0A4Q9PID7_9APHY|nr:hypothetical protein BD310DRAFT_937083 [Dichomitus squalens]